MHLLNQYKVIVTQSYIDPFHVICNISCSLRNMVVIFCSPSFLFPSSFIFFLSMQGVCFFVLPFSNDGLKVRAGAKVRFFHCNLEIMGWNCGNNLRFRGKVAYIELYSDPAVKGASCIGLPFRCWFAPCGRLCFPVEVGNFVNPQDIGFRREDVKLSCHGEIFFFSFSQMVPV